MEVLNFLKLISMKKVLSIESDLQTPRRALVVYTFLSALFSLVLLFDCEFESAEAFGIISNY